MKSSWERDIEELESIRTRLKHARDLDADEVQELYYRKNFIESGLAINDQCQDYGEDE